jgi:hypothetical protein
LNLGIYREGEEEEEEEEEAEEEEEEKKNLTLMINREWMGGGQWSSEWSERERPEMPERPSLWCSLSLALAPRPHAPLRTQCGLKTGAECLAESEACDAYSAGR